MIASPYFWLALLLGALAVGGSGYYYGDQHATNAAKAAQLVAVERAVAQANITARADAAGAAKSETQREKIRVVYRNVRERANADIDKNPGYGLCSFSADGLRLYNARPDDGADTAAGGNAAVPGFAPGSGRETGDDPAQQPGAGADVLRLPGAAGRAGGLGEAVGCTLCTMSVVHRVHPTMYG